MGRLFDYFDVGLGKFGSELKYILAVSHAARKAERQKKKQRTEAKSKLSFAQDEQQVDEEQAEQADNEVRRKQARCTCCRWLAVGISKQQDQVGIV